MPNVKTIELTDSETAVKFSENYPYFWVQNLGDSDVFMSVSPDIVPGGDGVMLIPAKSGRSTGDVGQTDTLYLSGSGKVEITAQYNAVCPFFKRVAKGGDGGFSGDYNDLANKPDIPVPSEVIDSNSTNETVSTSKAVFDYVAISDNTALASANSYTDTAIANLVGTAPDTLNTLEELAAAVQNNETVVEALDSAITNKADKASLSAHTDNKNNPHNVKPNQIAVNPFISVVGKTIGEFKTLILNWWDNSCGTLDVYLFFGGSSKWWLTNFDNNDAIIPDGYGYQITPIMSFYPNKNFAKFLFANSLLSDSILFLERHINDLKLGNITRDSLIKSGISDPTTDWNAITESGLYTIGYNGGITADSHGPLGVTSWGLLTVINTGLGKTSPACIRQIYETGISGCYIREKWQIHGEWGPWYKYQCQEYTPAQNEEV